MLKLICGESGTGKSTLLRERIRDAVLGGKKALLAAGLVLCVLLLLFSAVYGVFSYYYGKLNIANPDDDTAVYLDERDLEIKEGEEETENSALEDIQSLEEALKVYPGRTR